MITKDLGAVSAYAYAVEQGYTGTEAEYAELMASYASVAQQTSQSAQTATEKAQQASASATSASQSADTASASAQTAQTAQQTASTKASEAQQSATTATTKAQEASQSASESSQSASTAVQAKTDAETAKQASETAQRLAESARDGAAQSASEAAASAESIDPETLEHKAYGAYVVESASGAIASFADGADSIPMKDVLVHIEPVQEGSGDPSPDNVRPITGWTGAQVVRAGKNLLPVSNPSITNNGITFTVNDDGSITVNGTATSQANFFCVISPIGGLENGKTYFLSGCPNGGGPDRYALWLNNGGTAQDNGSGVSIVYNGQEVVGRIRVASGTVCNNLVFRPQFELGSTATEYKPYTGSTYPITFPTEAGTVYGGYVDVTGGELVVDRAQIASYNGEALPSTWISDRDVYASGTTPTIGAQVVYKLAEPTHYPLAPIEIKTLLGQNNIWADCGDTEVEYRADVKLYINKKIAEAISALS